jgi:hypothetical protein
VCLSKAVTKTIELTVIQNLLLYSEKSIWPSPDTLFQLSVIYKSCRQTLTPASHSQLLLKLPILDKLRLVTFHTCVTQRNYNIGTGIHWFRRNESSHDLDSRHAILTMSISKHTQFLQ